MEHTNDIFSLVTFKITRIGFLKGKAMKVICRGG